MHNSMFVIPTAKAKRTYAWTMPVAMAVAMDYEKRFGEGHLEAAYGDAAEDFHLDFGGMFMVGTPALCVEATYGGDAFKLSFWVHQADLVVGAMRKALAQKREGYGKIHGAWNCICLPTPLIESLVPAVEAILPEAERLDRESLADWKAKHA